MGILLLDLDNLVDLVVLDDFDKTGQNSTVKFRENFVKKDDFGTFFSAVQKIS